MSYLTESFRNPRYRLSFFSPIYLHWLWHANVASGACIISCKPWKQLSVYKSIWTARVLTKKYIELYESRQIMCILYTILYIILYTILQYIIMQYIYKLKTLLKTYVLIRLKRMLNSFEINKIMIYNLHL